MAISVGFLAAIAAFVVYSSFQVSDYECEVCMTFDGHQACRKVTGKTEEEGMRTGIDNACAQISSGVTDTLRCSHSKPDKAICRPLDR